MRQRYVFIFTDSRFVFVVVAVVFFVFLLISAGILIGLQIYPQVATTGPKKDIVRPVSAAVTDTSGMVIKSAPKTDSTLTYILNSVKYSDLEVVILPETRYYTIQLGLFAGRERAQSRLADLRKGGITSYIFSKADKNKQWYAVRAGIFDNQAAARRAALALKKKYGTKPAVRSYGTL